MPVSAAEADPYTTAPDGEPREGTVPAEYAALVAALLALLAASLTPTPGVPWPDWAASALRGIPGFRDQVRQRIGRVAGRLDRLVTAAVTDITTRAAASAAADTRWTGPLPGVDAARVREAVDALTSAHARIQAVLEDTYRRAVFAAQSSADPGLAVQRVLDDLAARGITGYTDRAGRRWSLETYVETVVRAHYAEAALDAYRGVCEAAGVRLVTVSRSPGACPRCVPWEGRVLSIDGTPAGTHTVRGPLGPRLVSVAGTLAQAREAGLLHPWCRHRLTALVPGRVRRLARGPEVDRVARAGRRYRRRMALAWERRERVALTDARRRVAGQRARRWRDGRGSGGVRD